MKNKNNIALLITILLLSVSISLSIYNHIVDIQNTQQQLKQTSLPLSVDNVYTQVQKRMIEPMLISSMMANDTFLKDWALHRENDEHEIVKYLKEIQNKYKVFTTFFVSDKTKNYYHPKGLIDTINAKNIEDDWFFNFKKLNEEYEVNLDYNKNIDDSLIMFINYKVFDYNKNFIGATGIGIKLFHLQRMLKEFKQKHHYDVYFVDEASEIILHSKELDKRGNIKNIDGLKDIQPKIFNSKISQFEYKTKDNNYLLNTKYIEELKLYLFVEVNEKEYMETLRKTFFLNLLISILSTIIVVFIIVKVVNNYQKQLEDLARKDVLTNIFNRRAFNESFTNILNLYKRDIDNISLILLDIDNFKSINDEHGHLVGDKVLVRFAMLLKDFFRKSDIVARWGGEEFAILLSNTKKEHALVLANELKQLIQEDEILQTYCDKKITASFGVGEITTNESQDGLIQRVDKALYKAKTNGKNRVEEA